MIEVMENEPPSDKLSSSSTSNPDFASSLEEPAVIPVAPATSAVQPPTIQRRKLTTKRIAMLVVLIALVVAGAFGMFKLLSKPAKNTPTSVVINTQSLENGTLNKLEPTDTSAIRQQLTIEPNTIFKNDVKIQGSTEVTKNLAIGGTASIQGATTIKDSLVIGKSLSVGTNLTVNGLITAASLSVGSINISTVNISGNLAFGGHIIPSGNQPAVKAGVASATVSISGNDTAGTITITTSGGGQTAGEMAIITFHTAFGLTPKVQLTPLSSASATLPYFITHSPNFFTINAASAPAANSTYIFDYLVTQ